MLFRSDDSGAMEALEGMDLFTFALGQEADCRAEDIRWEQGLPSFDIVIRGQLYAHVDLQVGGRHNISNALAAASGAYVLGLPGQAVTEGLAAFRGAGRRFEYKGSYHGAEVYDDYAHHPGELHALLDMVRPLGYKRIVCAFQPDRKSVG